MAAYTTPATSIIDRASVPPSVLVTEATVVHAEPSHITMPRPLAAKTSPLLAMMNRSTFPSPSAGWFELSLRETARKVPSANSR